MIKHTYYSTVRKIIGYKRLETEEQKAILNQIYVLLSDYLNFFIPTFKLEKKEHVGARVKRVYAKPKTPYQRVREHPNISKKIRVKLKEKYSTLNPLILLEQINKLTEKLLTS